MKIQVRLIFIFYFIFCFGSLVVADDRFEIAALEDTYNAEWVHACQNPATGDVLVYFLEEVWSKSNTLYAVLLTQEKDYSFKVGELKKITSVTEDIREVNCAFSEAADSFIITWEEEGEKQDIYKAMTLSSAGQWMSKEKWIFNSTSSRIKTAIPVSISATKNLAPQGSVFALICFVEDDSKLDNEYGIYYLNAQLNKIGKPVGFYSPRSWGWDNVLVSAHAVADGGYFVNILEEVYSGYDSPRYPMLIKIDSKGSKENAVTITPNEISQDRFKTTQLKSGNYYSTWREDNGHGHWSRMFDLKGNPVGNPMLSSRRIADITDVVTTDNKVTYILNFGDRNNQDYTFYAAKVKKTGKNTKFKKHPYTDVLFYPSGYEWFSVVPVKGTKSYLLVTVEREGKIYGNVYP